MAYTASSVKKALMASKKLDINGLETLGCPNNGNNLVDGKTCGGIPKVCPAALGNFGCKQQVHVRIKGIKALYTILYFYFPVSNKNTDGYIKEDNSELGRLLDNDYVDRSILETI
jgi:hypothetical protein